MVLMTFPILIMALNVEIEQPQISANQFTNNLPKMMNIGEPAIPFVPIKILLPMGEKLAEISVNFSHEKTLNGSHYIDFTRQPQPFSQKTFDATVPNNKIYESEKIFPNSDYKILGTQTFKGYNLLLINLYPYKYSPKNNEIIWFENAQISFSTTPNSDLKNRQNEMLISDEETKLKVKNIVINRENIKSYQKEYFSKNRSLVDAENPFEMIIITNSECEPYFTDFINWKAAHNTSATTFLTADIYAEYEGINDQEKIKNFIRDAFITFSDTETPLEYVILGGDDEIVPIRTIWIDTGFGYFDSNMPSDLFYGCLDDNWDDNGNGIYAELEDNPDIIPDVTIGRFPAETETEFANIFNKTYDYIETTNVSNDIAYTIGENLNWNPVTWGGDYNDALLEEVPTLGFDYHLFKLYDREGTYSPQNVKSAINNGLSIINHMGHSNESVVFGQNMGSVNSYTNTEFGFAYTQGCYPAAFDEMTSQQGESIAENLVKGERGLYAFVGNTRYGWYSPGSTDGPSQPYDVEFFKAIFENDMRQLGKALDESRVVLANTALEYGCNRWVHMELVLFGDPSVGVKYPIGSFPFIQPYLVEFDDSQTGDGDETPNPGENIEINVVLENLPNWADATDVSATINFYDETIQILTEEVFFGNIQSGTLATSSPFLISIPQDCNYDSYKYSVTITAPVTENSYFERSFDFDLKVSLFQQNWPWTNSASVFSNPIITNFDSDNDLDILIVDANSNINLLDINANQQTGFPLNGDAGIWRSTAFGDIDDDGNAEIIIANRNGEIIALDNSGNEIFNNAECCEQLLTPIISDVDGDENADIISFGMNGMLNVLDNSGNMLANFPVDFEQISLNEMASADLDEDGKNEILIAFNNGNLHAINYLGENIDGFPVEFSASLCSAPIILDNFKIAVGTSDNKIHLIDNTGNILFTKNLSGRVVKSAIATDFDNDEILEIAFATTNGELHIIDQNGEYLNGWPIDINSSIPNAPLTADINNDDLPDLLCFNSASDFFAFKANGEEFDFAPVPVNLIGNTPPTVDDIDNDGDFDIIAGTTTGAIIIDCKLPKGVKIPWNTYRGNYCRTGFYGDNKISTNVDNDELEIANFKLTNYPNPFSNTTTISFSLNTENTKNAKIEIYNIKGQKVKTFSNLQTSQSAIWNANKFASGIYFYRLIADDKIINTKKCLLIK